MGEKNTEIVLFERCRRTFRERMIGNTPAARVNLPHRAADNNKMLFRTRPHVKNQNKVKEIVGDGPLTLSGLARGAACRRKVSTERYRKSRNSNY